MDALKTALAIAAAVVAVLVPLTTLILSVGALTRTARLRSSIRTDQEILKDLPADSQAAADLSRAILTRTVILAGRVDPPRYTAAGGPLSYGPARGTTFGVHLPASVYQAVGAAVSLGLLAVAVVTLTRP